MRKYGKDEFVVHVAEYYASADDAIRGEIEWIAYLKEMSVVLYNETTGGDGAAGRKNSLETIGRMRKAAQGRVISLEQREQISRTLKARGVTHNSETRAAISLTLKGRPKPTRTAEHCEKLRIAALKRPKRVYSEETRARMREAALRRKPRQAS